MSLDMLGHIDSVFQSTPATRISKPGSYVDGRWIEGNEVRSRHVVTLQPASDKERDNISQGGERIVDARRVYVNDGVLTDVSPADEWQFVAVDGVFKTFSLDNRPWRNYCKVVVYRTDR